MIVPEAARCHIDRHRGIGWQEYPRSCEDDFEQIKPYLPEKAKRILDIGCGMAGVDVYLCRHYQEAELWLLDGDGDDPRAGWNQTLLPFSSRAAAEDLLSANGVGIDRWIDVNTTEALSADLIVSFASWGYHYPIGTYDVSGFCIADLRKSVERVRGKVIATYRKRNRCAWRQS